MSVTEESLVSPVDNQPAEREEGPRTKVKKSMREKIDSNDGAMGIRNISSIRSKIRRNQEWVRLKKEKSKEKRKRQDERKKVGCNNC